MNRTLRGKSKPRAKERNQAEWHESIKNWTIQKYQHFEGGEEEETGEKVSVCWGKR